LHTAGYGAVEAAAHTFMSNSLKENQIDYVEFPATSAQAFASVKQFYKEVFGWSFQDWGEDYSDTKDSGIASGFSADASHRPAAPLVVLFTADLEAAKERVIKAGGRIAKDIVSFPGGRRFQYIDPAGNQLGVWSDK
jgi:uncharacterized protein